MVLKAAADTKTPVCDCIDRKCPRIDESTDRKWTGGARPEGDGVALDRSRASFGVMEFSGISGDGYKTE
jgi:hypothetical protein